jgi:hypothetical protein
LPAQAALVMPTEPQKPAAHLPSHDAFVLVVAVPK